MVGDKTGDECSAAGLVEFVLTKTCSLLSLSSSLAALISTSFNSDERNDGAAAVAVGALGVVGL